MAKEGSAWLPGKGSPVLYGLWMLPEARQQRAIHLVEGESDCWTLWFHGHAALGFPGATMTHLLRAENLAAIDTVFIHREADEAGANFTSNLKARLAELESVGEVFVIGFCTETKDANALHCACQGDRGRFAAAFNNLIGHAERLESNRPIRSRLIRPKTISRSRLRGATLTTFGT